MRKRKLYLSELLNKYIAKSYQYIFIEDCNTYEKYYCNKSNIMKNKKNVPQELLDKQVKSWEFIENSLYIYI